MSDFNLKDLKKTTAQQTAIIAVLWTVTMTLAGFLFNEMYGQLKLLNANMVINLVKDAEQDKDILQVKEANTKQDQQIGNLWERKANKSEVRERTERGRTPEISVVPGTAWTFDTMESRPNPSEVVR